MKKIGLVLFALVLSTSIIIAQEGKKAPKAAFNNLVHDYGKVEESLGSVSCEFIFKNTGNAPLIVQRVQTTCGCTTPDSPKEPILPGKEGKITVTYSTIGRPGFIDKKVTVFTNVPDEVYVLQLKGEVVRKK